MRQPSLFISHGAPDLILSDSPTSSFLRALGQRLPRPRAIVVATAHWTTTAVQLSVSQLPETIHDFSGFAPELSAVRYAAPGDPALAQQGVDLLARAGIAALATPRGFDHGVWSPLVLMYPDANIPVVSLSVQPHAGAAHHLAVGAALAPLRADNVLIIGSGSATHNLAALRHHDQPEPAWVSAFDAWLIERAVAGDLSGLEHWMTQAPFALRNHPSPEHFLPAVVAAGAGAGAPATVLHRATTYSALAMTALAFDWSGG